MRTSQVSRIIENLPTKGTIQHIVKFSILFQIKIQTIYLSDWEQLQQAHGFQAENAFNVVIHNVS